MIRIICSGDLHLGRRASRLPTSISSTEADLFSGAQGWRDLVRLAVDLQVDLVALSGDVIDRANRYFEAYGPLEQGVRTLAQAGIPVVAVAGNHDFDVLPRMAADLSPEQFRLLGLDGQWERFTLMRQGAPSLHIDGWSFPRRHVDASPLSGYDLAPPSDGVVVGLLHADLDQINSNFGPVQTSDLLSKPPAFWVLGHWHGPLLREHHGQPKILYPGSPMALSPSETGGHGPWLVQIDSGGQVSARQVLLSRVRYENVAVDVDGATDLSQVEDRVARQVRDRLSEVTAEQGDSLHYLITRLILTGRTPVHRFLERHLSALAEDLNPHWGTAQAIVDSIEVATRPQWDLQQIADMPGPPGTLARMLLSLEEPGDPLRADLLADARVEMERLQRLHYYRDLDLHQIDSSSDKYLAAILKHQGLLLLDELLAQKDEAP